MPPARFVVPLLALALLSCSVGQRPQPEKLLEPFHLALDVPDEWTEVADEDDGQLLFESPEQDSLLRIRKVAVGRDCFAEMMAWLGGEGIVLAEQQAFRITTLHGTLPALEGAFQSQGGAREGKVKAFCEGKTAIVVVASFPREASDDRIGEITRLMSSVTHWLEERKPVKRAQDGGVCPFVHEVEWRGQTLSRIAGWYTGDEANWKALTLPVNPDLESCCVPLRTGRRVRIPCGLLVTQDPLPSSTPLPARPASPPRPSSTPTPSPPG